MEEFDTPAFLERPYLPSDVAVAGVETRSGPDEISFFRQHESAH